MKIILAGEHGLWTNPRAWPPLDPMRLLGWPILAILLFGRVGLLLAGLFSSRTLRKPGTDGMFPAVLARSQRR